MLADGLGVRPQELVFTPGGPAALRLGLAGLQYAARRRGMRVVASAVEHSAILSAGRHLATVHGEPELLAEVPVDRHGRVHLSAWEQALDRPGSAVAALQAANSEVGTRQPVQAARQLCQQRGIPLLVDATASLGRDPVPPPDSYDLLAADARSWGGPPGVGVLVVPARTRWRLDAPPSEIEAGRAEVEPVVPLALAAAEAWRQTMADPGEASEAGGLVGALAAAAAAVPETVVAGDPVDRLPHVLTCSFLLADGEALVTELDRRGIAVASGSACTSSRLEPSHVLTAMGVLTHGNMRVTLPLRAVAPDRAAWVARLAAELPDAVASVRAQLVGR